MRILPSARLISRLLLGVALCAASAASPAAPEVVRIGVATAGGGDPITWGGSPGGVA
ncbi:MAG TPA: nitrate ABC transporter substrate-binding protein, partial [Achromobacter sp.]|nr:nitrate ABC transporter substrate-binding protein [Achromobacter sp.]